MAVAKPAGRDSYVSLSMDDMKESKNSGDESDDEGKKQKGNVQAEGSRALEDCLDEFNEVFRRKVRDKYCSAEDISWSSAADEVKVELLSERYEDGGRRLCDDPLLMLLKKWPASEKCCENPRLIESQINRLVTIILSKDSSKKYKYFKDKDELSWKTPLHLAAELNYTSVAQSILCYYPGQLYITTNPHSANHNRRSLPVELSLVRHNDDVSAFLIENMKPERVLRLFSCEFQENPISFQELVKHCHMKKTVVAILNCMVRPDWRHLPKYKKGYSSQMKKDIELAWSSEPSDPITYQFHYKILDGDDCGRGPTDEAFNWKSKSCLFLIANSASKEAIQHPVVRQLVKRKWKKYAHFWFSVLTGLYVMFLLLLSFALLYGSTKNDPTRYHGNGDSLRMVCEIFVIFCIVGYIADEISEMEKECLSYFKGAQFYYNLFDWLGLILILTVIPLRFSGHNAQWVVASLGFFFNVLRLFKYSCITRATGLYTKTLARIVYYDITRFTCVFFVVFLAFCGAFFLSLRATSAVQVFGGFNKVMLSGVRALVEQQPAAEDYTRYNWLPVTVILIYMTAVVVILLNILIAQMSSTYSIAKKTARLQYDVDRMLIITRLEHSRFHKFNLRLNYYQEEDVIDEMTLAKDLLEYSEDRSPWESIEDKLDEIRNIMRKIIKRIPLADEDKQK